MSQAAGFKHLSICCCQVGEGCCINLFLIKNSDVVFIPLAENRQQMWTDNIQFSVTLPDMISSHTQQKQGTKLTPTRLSLGISFFTSIIPQSVINLMQRYHKYVCFNLILIGFSKRIKVPNVQRIIHYIYTFPNLLVVTYCLQRLHSERSISRAAVVASVLLRYQGCVQEQYFVLRLLKYTSGCMCVGRKCNASSQ